MATTKALTNRIKAISSYLSPMLPIANSHMVEFITREHWTLLPDPLRCYLDGKDLGEAVHEFWQCHSNKGNNDKSELSKWISDARSHYVSITDQLCLSTEQLQHKIEAWGGTVKHELTVTEFMTQKKSYEATKATKDITNETVGEVGQVSTSTPSSENGRRSWLTAQSGNIWGRPLPSSGRKQVQTMSQLVASLFDATKATCSVEAGGGRGHLQVALCLGYRVPSLTVDCNEQALAAAEARARMIKKQWHVIAKRADGGTESRIQQNDENLHRFAAAFITRDSDLASIVRKQFPDHEDTRLLLTGLHTCGDLGPTSLRLFERHSSTAAVFNVPCCYHLLTEGIEGEEGNVGFPMSQCLSEYSLGRNARMLANHSIERMVHHRELPPRSLLYRAMLEVIIETYAPHSRLATGKLKRISSKADSFQTYFKMADGILKLGLFGTLPDKFLQELIQNEDKTWKKLILFYLMKLCLAQVVESLILLDRIMYLYENGFEDAYLVKLFDPVLSPRCHSIVAVRNY